MPSPTRRRLGLLGGALVVFFAAQGMAVFINPGSHTLGSVSHRELLGPAQIAGDTVDDPSVIEGPLVPCAPLSLAAAAGGASSPGRGGVAIRRETDGAYVTETIVHEVDDSVLSLLLDHSCPTLQIDTAGDRYETTVTESGWVRSGVSFSYEEATELRLVDGTLVAISVSTTFGPPSASDVDALAESAVVQLDERAIRASQVNVQRLVYGIIGLAIIGLLVGIGTLAKRSYLGVVAWILAYGFTGVTLSVTLAGVGIPSALGGLMAFVFVFGLLRGELARLHARAAAGGLHDIDVEGLPPQARALLVETDHALAEVGYKRDGLSVDSRQRMVFAVWNAPASAQLVYGTIASTRSRTARYLTVHSPLAQIEAGFETAEFGGTPGHVLALREIAVGSEVVDLLQRHATTRDELERAGVVFAADASSYDLEEDIGVSQVALSRIPLRYAWSGVLWTIFGRRRKGVRRPRGWDRALARLLDAQRQTVTT